MRVSAPADKRFRRAHVHPARKRSRLPSWRRLVPALMLGALIGYGLYRAAGLLRAADAFTVTRITVEGTQRMSRGEVLALLHGLRGRNMLTADLEAWRRRLLVSPWVADAVLRRVFPGTVAVIVAEREPLAIGRVGGGLYLIDRRGTIIDEFGPTYAEFDLPIVDGLSAAAGNGGTLVDETRALLAARLLADVQRHPELAKRISQIDVSDPRDAVVIVNGDAALIRVGDDRFAERVQSYLDLAARLRESVPRIDYVDLRFGDRVYVKPVGSGAKGQ
jgi:cell division protein FtsQ